MTAAPKPHPWIAAMLLDAAGARLASTAEQAQQNDGTQAQRGQGSRQTTLFNDPNDPE